MLSTVLALVATAAPLGQSISGYVPTTFKDLSFTAKVQTAKQSELAKINQDFAKSYRFKSSNVWLKEPMMLRMEARVEDTDIYFIVNGGRKLVKIPRANINQRDDVSKAPGKRQTPLDFGLLTPSLFSNFINAKFVRKEASGDYAGYGVFDLTYIEKLDDSSRHRVWIDPERKFTAKREWYNQQGYLLATFTYTDAQKVNGLWIPTKATVRNSSGAFGGTTAYLNIKVNQGIAESLFKVD
ncbi:MAG: outer membrane lipoprotein-sorting protein [Armatimonadetes bacterium]|nr:outer membrane lipoprotein-sorting protein [Armatimonadota bacterium]